MTCIYEASDTDPCASESRVVRVVAMLVGLGIKAGTRVLVLCCDRHAIDRGTATEAGLRLGAEVSVDRCDDANLAALTALRPELTLACEEGVELVSGQRWPGRVVGDGPGVLWWKALEAQAG